MDLVTIAGIELGLDLMTGLSQPVRRLVDSLAPVSDRILVSRQKGIEEVRELKVGLAADKETIAVSLKAQ